MPGLVVVDTNVVVAGLLTRDPSSAPTARILDAMIAGRLRFALSLALLTEYREVLLRPRIAARHGLRSREIDSVLETLAVHARVVEPEDPGPPAPNPQDQHLWDLLGALEDPVLVTGDGLLSSSETFTVWSPREMVDRSLSST